MINSGRQLVSLSREGDVILNSALIVKNIGFVRGPLILKLPEIKYLFIENCDPIVTVKLTNQTFKGEIFINSYLGTEGNKIDTESKVWVTNPWISNGFYPKLKNRMFLADYEYLKNKVQEPRILIE